MQYFVSIGIGQPTEMMQHQYLGSQWIKKGWGPVSDFSLVGFSGGIPFGSLTLLVGWLEGQPVSKNPTPVISTGFLVGTRHRLEQLQNASSNTTLLGAFLFSISAFAVNNFYHFYILHLYTVSGKKEATLLLPFCHVLTSFQNSFTVRLCSKFVVKQ